MPVPQYRNFTFTAFDDVYTPVNWESGSELRKCFKHVAFSLEVCPHTQREHLQGYCAVWKPASFTKARVALQTQWSTAHVEVMRDSYVVSEGYCSKDARRVEFGVSPNEPGVKNSVLAYKHRIDEGEEVLEIAEDNPMFGTYLQYRNGLHEYKRYKRMKRVQDDRTMPDVFLRFGAAGTGKTKWLDDSFGRDGWVQAPDNTGQWFDGCDRDVVLFDDVEAGQIPALSKFKRLCDRYPLQVPVKGGFITWKPRVIVFTSNQHWNTWWKDITPADFEAIKRRFKRVTYIRDDGSEDVQWERDSI